MLTKTKMERLVGRAILDPDFRKLLLSDPDSAAKKIRASLSDMERISIQNMNVERLEWWAEGFEALKDDNSGFLW
jgi:hypothetical protein